MSLDLRPLGKLVAEEHDAYMRDERVKAKARELFHRKQQPSFRARAAPWLGLAAAILAVVVSMIVLRHESVVECRDEVGVRLDVGARVGGGPREQALRFSDGTTVLLAPGARGRVDALHRDGGAVVVEDGKASVSVPPKMGRRWKLSAGPYDVLVTGTRFDLTWDDPRRRFELVMFDGSVEVSGPGLTSRTVVAGQRLDLGGDANAPTEATAGPVPGPSAAPASMPPPVDDKPVETVDLPAAPTRPAPEKTWQALARQGQFDEAMTIVESTGFEGVCSSGSAAEVLLLGDAARYAKRSSRARVAYQAVRDRFAGTPEASRAAFVLGVMAFPQKGAIPWFERYLAESPGGPLASEALGRILEIHDRSGDRAAARAVAERYLAAYPNGAHAKLARSLVVP